MALDTLRLLASCPDRPGIISTVSGFLYERGANIVRSDQYTSDDGTFYLRMEFTVPTGHRVDLVETYGLAVANPYGMSWRVADSRYVKRIAILASKADHCLVDLLWRWRRGQLPAQVTRVAPRRHRAAGPAGRRRGAYGAGPRRAVALRGPAAAPPRHRRGVLTPLALRSRRSQDEGQVSVAQGRQPCHASS